MHPPSHVVLSHQFRRFDHPPLRRLTSCLHYQCAVVDTSLFLSSIIAFSPAAPNNSHAPPEHIAAFSRSDIIAPITISSRPETGRRSRNHRRALPRYMHSAYVDTSYARTKVLYLMSNVHLQYNTSLPRLGFQFMDPPLHHVPRLFELLEPSHQLQQRRHQLLVRALHTGKLLLQGHHLDF